MPSLNSPHFFALIDYTVSVTVNPENSGVVNGEGTYNMDDLVNLTATANIGYEFVYWSDLNDVVVHNYPDYNFYMPVEDVSLIANFEKKDYDLTIAIEGEGSETELGAGTHSIEFDEEVTLIADPAESWEFINWTDENNLHCRNGLGVMRLWVDFFAKYIKAYLK